MKTAKVIWNGDTWEVKEKSPLTYVFYINGHEVEYIENNLPYPNCKDLLRQCIVKNFEESGPDPHTTENCNLINDIMSQVQEY